MRLWLWRSSSEVVPGSGMCSVLMVTAGRVAVRLMCMRAVKPLPITNAASPLDRMETEGKDWSGWESGVGWGGGGGGGEGYGGYRQNL